MARDHGVYFDLIISGMRATQWAKAKGELLATVQVVGGTTPSRPVGSKELEQWECLEQRVLAFIKDVEDNGLHE